MRSSSDPRHRETSALAALVGHELNNIAVPLNGFTELAVQGMAAGEPVSQSLHEIQIAIGRIRSLASELEILGETESLRDPVAIGDCMPQDAGTGAPVLKIDWRCSAAALVRADRLHTRSAIQALAGLAQPGEACEQPASVIVSQHLPFAARCAACDAAVARDGDSVIIEGHASRTILAAALRAPFAGSRVTRPGRRLTLAVLVHSAHCAGGHILLDESSGLLSLVLASG